MRPMITRKHFLLGAAATAALAARPAHAAAKFTIRVGVDVPNTHPIAAGLAAAGKAIGATTKGEVNVLVFPNSQLGDDTHMLANVRSGAMQMMSIGDNILATLVPSAAIDNIGFAFKNADMAWKALDGKVGDLVRADIDKAGLVPMPRIWDEGFRQTTSSTKPIQTAADLDGFKIRVPPSPISLAMFKALGASPVSINVAELYTALQTHVVDGQENPLGNIESHKFYQVQKYCSLTNHMWVGFWLVANKGFWTGLPADVQKVVAAAFDAEALKEREANEKLDASLGETLKQQGMTFNSPALPAFQQKLANAGFYKTWQEKLGAKLWSALEKYTGQLG